MTAMLPSRPRGEDRATRAGEVVDPDTVLTRPAVGAAPRIVSTLRLPRRRRGREIVAVLDPVRARPVAGDHPGDHQRSDQQVVEAAAERLAGFNREVEIEIHEGRLDEDRLATMLRGVDLALDCTDNFPTRFAINGACVRARKPLVSGAAIRFEGQLAVFDARRADSPCYACLFPDAGEAAERCEEAGILGPVVGSVGNLQALAAIKLLLGLADEAGTLHLWDALNMDWKRWRVPRDPGCPVCGLHDD
mgnify:CR=1 FL=1